MKINIKELFCNKCGHEWSPRKKEVRQCPKCKSAWWDVPVEQKPFNPSHEVGGGV